MTARPRPRLIIVIPPEETGRIVVVGLHALASRLELRERLAAIVDELDLLDADDADVPRTIALGLLEDVEHAVAADDRPSERRRP